MSEVGVTIGQTIARLRKEKRLSLQDVADRAGVTRTHIWALEHGKSKNPTVNVAISIANALGCSLDYLTGLSNSLPNLHPEALRIACEIDAIIKEPRP